MSVSDSIQANSPECDTTQDGEQTQDRPTNARRQAGGETDADRQADRHTAAPKQNGRLTSAPATKTAAIALSNSAKAAGLRWLARACANFPCDPALCVASVLPCDQDRFS